MDSAMRDLEELRERDDGEGRPVGLILVLVGVTVALVLAMGLWMGGFTDTDEVAQNDPLAQLDRGDGLTAAQDIEPAADVPDVDRAQLTFPEALAGTDERPEVAAALAAAAAELAHPDPVGPTALPATTLPASMAGLAAPALPRAQEDPLVAEALPAPAPTAHPAAPGHDGEYTLQVISYDNQEEAQAFATTLRSRGHRAFVVSADVEGRGTMWRVRIGPFETQNEAQTFRQQFEREERMNTLLVRRRDESESQ
jgi:cell division septation protein DedD